MIGQITELLRDRRIERASPARKEKAPESVRTFDLSNHLLILERGTILDVIPYLRHYRVALLGGGVITCTYLSDAVFNPSGVASAITLIPGTTVLVARIPSETYGLILAAIPEFVKTYGDSPGDEIVQASNVGFFGDLYQKAIMYYQSPSGGGIYAWKDGMVDSLPGDWVKFSRFGAALFLTDFLSGFRLNEYCGIWMNHLDSLLRICGLNYQLWTGGAEEYSLLYWNAFLRYKGYGFTIDNQLGKRVETISGSPYISIPPNYYENPDARVSNIEHVSTFSGETSQFSRLPQHRVQEWEGVLGQGGMKWVYSFKPTPTGYFRLPVAQVGFTAHGTYVLQSRSGILFAKYPLISGPVRVSDPDELYGKPNISEFQTKLSDFLFRTSGVGFTGRLPLISYMNIFDIRNLLCNWEATAGFYLFPQKFRFITEKDVVSVIRKKIDLYYSTLNSPAFFYIDSVGNITIQNSAGASISLIGGKIRISAPDEILIDSGGPLTCFGSQASLFSEGYLEVVGRNKVTLQSGISSMYGGSSTQGQGTSTEAILDTFRNKPQVLVLDSSGNHYLSGCLLAEYISAQYQRAGQCTDVSAGGSYQTVPLPRAVEASPWLYNVVFAGVTSIFKGSEILYGTISPRNFPSSLDQYGAATIPAEVGNSLQTVYSGFPTSSQLPNLGFGSAILVHQ